MNNLVFFIFVVIFVSCSDLRYDDADKNVSALSVSELLICHHPGTEHHNSVCVEKQYPEGCYVTGDNSKFCWVIRKDDCEGFLEFDWQLNNCPLLKGK